eukprot:1374943-Rhodomonas_salina.3
MFRPRARLITELFRAGLRQANQGALTNLAAFHTTISPDRSTAQASNPSLTAAQPPPSHPPATNRFSCSRFLAPLSKQDSFATFFDDQLSPVVCSSTDHAFALSIPPTPLAESSTNNAVPSSR